MAEQIRVRIKPDRLRALAAEHEINTNAALAERLGVTRSYLQRLLSGGATVGTKLLFQIHAEFGVRFPDESLFTVSRSEV